MNILRGIGHAPAVVGIARGVLEAAVMEGLILFAAYVTGHGLPPEWANFTPMVLFAIRTAEGAADHIDPAKNRTPAPPAP